MDAVGERLVYYKVGPNVHLIVYRFQFLQRVVVLKPPKPWGHPYSQYKKRDFQEYTIIVVPLVRSVIVDLR